MTRLRPRKSLGQHFLRDEAKLRAIVTAANPAPGDTVLEIGPGTGALTGPLAATGARVVAVEKDRALHDLLRNRFGPDSPSWSLVHEDALDGRGHVSSAVERALGGRSAPFMLVANLPYNAASPIIADLTTSWPGMRRAVVTIQKEVAERLAASPGSKAYGRLGILVQAFCAVEYVCAIPPGCFWPPPRVHSAAVRLDRHPNPFCADADAFSRFLHLLFSKRRKQVGTVLGRAFPFPPAVDPASRPEDLDLPTLVALSALHQGTQVTRRHHE